MPTLTCHTPYTASKVALLSMQNDFKLQGLPRSIVSERDSSILPSLELFKLQGAVIAMSTAYHPQTDGQTEIINKGLEDYLRCYAYAGEHPNSQAMVNMAPLFRVLIQYQLPCFNRGQVVDTHLTTREAILIHLNQNIVAA